MRFCPFCAQENTDEASECAHCGRKLPQVASRSVSSPNLPQLPTGRPAAVRPLPRPRAVPVAPALSPAAAPAPVAVPTPVAASAERTVPTPDPRGRTGTLLGVPAATSPETTRPNNDSLSDIETRVEASPFELKTTPTPKLESEPGLPTVQRRFSPDVSETTATGVHLPARPRRSADEDELTAVGSPTEGEEGPTDVHALPPRRPLPQRTPPLGVAARPSTTPPWGAPRKKTPAGGVGVTVPPPAPLPPPPGGAVPQVRADPEDVGTNPATKLPPAQLPPAPPPPPSGGFDEHEGAVTDEHQAAEADVPPMPLPPQPGLLPAVQYILPLVKAVWARVQLQKTLRQKLHGDQRVVDETLHELGRAAWQEPQRPAELREELTRADEDDERRRDAEKEVSRLDMAVVAERDRWIADEKRRREDIASRDAEVARLIEDLAERKRAQRIEDKVMKEVEARLRGVEKRATQLIAKAARAEVTPPEKGGGPNAAANLRREAEMAQKEADGIKPDLEAATTRVRELDAPIAELEQKLMQERAGLAAAQTELEAARKAHKDAVVATEAERVRQDEIRATAEKSIRLRLVSTGTVLSLHRLDGPQHKERFGPIYDRLDELKRIAAAGEQRINQLEAERHGYDKAGLQRGLIVVGSALGVFMILLVILIVVLSR